MLKRNLWKLILSVAVLAWAGAQLLPLQDQAFADYVRTHASAKSAEFGKLLEEAAARKKALQAPSEFVALKQLGRERRLDLTQYFPHIRLEESLKNIEKRNDILLAELLRLSRGRLQLGLDLKGGVAFTLEAVETPWREPGRLPAAGEAPEGDRDHRRPRQRPGRRRTGAPADR